MKHSRKLSIKLPIVICLLTCVLLYGLSCVIERSFEKFTIQQNVAELNSVLTSIKQELSYYCPNNDRDEFMENLLPILSSHHRLFVYIIDDSGKILYRTRGPNLAIAQSEIDFERIITYNSTDIWRYDNSIYRVAAAKIKINNGREVTTLVAVNRDLQLEFIERLHNGLLLLILIACIITFIATRVTIYYTQKPISSLIKKIETIDWKSLNHRISTTSVPKKYIGLIRAFNNMLSRMEDVFKKQHNFTADIAHEMRTPITNLTTQTEIALNNVRSVDEYREILYSNLEEYGKMSHMISDMLFLAQADNKELIPHLINIDLVETITMMCDYFEPLADEKNITLVLKGNCSHIQGDKLMLGRAISNLLSNAIRHTPVDSEIVILLQQLNEKVVKIIISNPGKKIAIEHLPHLFERFYRVDESRQRNGEGTGIGLAIVKSIIEAHKGLIYVESDDKATKFTIILSTSLN